jgi:hypothetical protein
MFRFLFRLIFLPFRVALAAVATAFRAGRVAGAVPFRVSGRMGRLLGFRGTLALVAGLALGLLFAPGPGRELREQIRALADRRKATSDADLAERVAFELEHAPRTWHLPQPAVTVVGGRVALSGIVDQEAAREELGRVAAAVPGVAAVENLMVLAESVETGRS